MQIESTNRNRNTKISTQILASHLCMCFQNPATNWSKFCVCVTQFWNWLATQFWFWGHTLSLLTYSMSENTFWVWGRILKVRTHCDFEDEFWGQGFQMWKSAPTLWGRGADAWWDHSGIGAKRSLFGICHPARHLIFFSSYLPSCCFRPWLGPCWHANGHSWPCPPKVSLDGDVQSSTLLYYISQVIWVSMIDIEIQISLSERSSGWAIN